MKLKVYSPIKNAEEQQEEKKSLLQQQGRHRHPGVVGILAIK